MASFQDLSRRAQQAFDLAGIAALVFRRTLARPFPALELSQRLAMLPATAPVSAPVSIRWSAQHVPFVEAASARDGAVGLGIVHGHLRLAQMEMMRRAAFGRLAEVVGAPALAADRVLRLLDFPRASEASLKLLPAATRAYVDGFADGINAAAAASLPPEFDILGVPYEPWDAKTLFAVSRLCSADYAWRVWRSLAKLRRRPDWAEAWAELAGATTLADDDVRLGAETVAQAFSRGSNCVALAGSRTATGVPILACDPHLVIATPSLWLIAGLRVPGLEVWGLMLPALPIFGVGRNAHGAWGGTNLHATSSELVDVAVEPVEVVPATIRLRGGGTRTIATRQSAFGLVVSDTELFDFPGESVALHWIGHRPSDEFTPFLGMMAASSWDEFATACDAYALPGLTMMWADHAGVIGKMMAVAVPSRPLATPPDIVVAPATARAAWGTMLTGKALPMEVSPERGFLVSCNEAPRDPPVTVSLFFAAPHRFDRLTELIAARDDFCADDVRTLQGDVMLESAHALAARFVAAARDIAGPVVDALAAWDGRYAADSAGALAFELVAEPLIAHLEARSDTRWVSPNWRPFARLELLVADAAPADLAEGLRAAVASAEKPFAEHGTWAALHRVRLAHPLARLPWLLGRLPVIEFGSGGSSETVMKSAHPFVRDKHVSTFGQNARFVADLSDPDGTTAVLLGGQDGWPGSRTMFDMVGPWRRGEQLRLPFTAAGLAEGFPHVTVVRPEGPAGARRQVRTTEGSRAGTAACHTADVHAARA